MERKAIINICLPIISGQARLHKRATIWPIKTTVKNKRLSARSHLIPSPGSSSLPCTFPGPPESFLELSISKIGDLYICAGCRINLIYLNSGIACERMLCPACSQGKINAQSNHDLKGLLNYASKAKAYVNNVLSCGAFNQPMTEQHLAQLTTAMHAEKEAKAIQIEAIKVKQRHHPGLQNSDKENRSLVKYEQAFNKGIYNNVVDYDQNLFRRAMKSRGKCAQIMDRGVNPIEHQLYLARKARKYRKGNCVEQAAVAVEYFYNQGLAGITTIGFFNELGGHVCAALNFPAILMNEELSFIYHNKNSPHWQPKAYPPVLENVIICDPWCDIVFHIGADWDNYIDHILFQAMRSSLPDNTQISINYIKII